MVTAVGKGFVAAEIEFGLGQHRSVIAKEKYQNYLKYDYLDWVQFFIALAVCKISICLFLLRLSQMNRLRLVLYGLIVFLVVTHIPLCLLILLQCNPLRKAWDEEVPGKCFSISIVENVIIARTYISGPFLLLLFNRFGRDARLWSKGQLPAIGTCLVCLIRILIV